VSKGDREKGAKAELEVAALLQAWWAQVEPAAVFKRTPQSGGWGGKEVRAAFRSAGDVMTDSKTFPFAVEVKRRERWAWKPFLAGKPSPVWAWWRQAQAQAEEMVLTPTLWFRRSRAPWMVLVPRFSMWLLNEGGDADLIPLEHDWVGDSILNVDFGRAPPVMVRGDDLLRVHPSHLRRDLG
jgi:hypothetical protein